MENNCRIKILSDITQNKLVHVGTISSDNAEKIRRGSMIQPQPELVGAYEINKKVCINRWSMLIDESRGITEQV